MGEKKINFWKIIKGIKRQSIRMQQRLIVYWCVVILTLFLVTVLLLSILGVLPGMDFKVREMLSAQQKNTLSTMTEQTDIMMARSSAYHQYDNIDWLWRLRKNRREEPV